MRLKIDRTKFRPFGTDMSLPPVHMEIDDSVKPVQQKRRPIALHYLDKFKDHIELIHRAAVISGPLE